MHARAFINQDVLKEQWTTDIPQLYLYENSPLRNYGEGSKKTTLHAGQLKLCLSEILFLHNHSKDGDLVIYAGAASGRHFPFILKYFPKLRYILIDPAPFDKTLIKIAKKETEMIKLENKFFTDELATTIRKNYEGDILFISDIRLEPNEKDIIKDMHAQERWHKILQPRYSMLKFRLPWGFGKFKYFDGQVQLQQYPPQTSTETRLIVEKNPKMRDWDTKQYEDQMFYHNTVARVRLYKIPKYEKIIKSTPGMDNCYDCVASLIILDKFIGDHNMSLSELHKELISTSFDQNYDMASWYVKGRIDYADRHMKQLYEELEFIYKYGKNIRKLLPILKKYKNLLRKF